MILTPLRRKLVLAYMGLILGVLSVSGVLLLRYLTHTFIRSLEDDLAIRAALVREHARGQWPEAPGGGDVVSSHLSGVAQVRITLISPDGIVVGESSVHSETMDNHSDRPEFQDAIRGATGISLRKSSTTRERMLYVALPVREDARVIGVVRVSMSAEAAYARVEAIRKGLIGALGTGVLLAAMLGISLGGKLLTEPLTEVLRGSREFVRGRLSHRINLSTGDEWEELASSLNGMAASIRDQVRRLSLSRHRVRSMLESLPDGVLLFSDGGSLLMANAPARRWLSLPRSLGECEHNTEHGGTEARPHALSLLGRTPELLDYCQKVIAGNAPPKLEISLHGPLPLRLDVRTHKITGETGGEILVLMRDITELRRLEQARRDMVANVSHELKTPIGAIRALAESLMGSPYEDPAIISDFLGRIVNETDRLARLVEEVMYLSRVESVARPMSISTADVTALMERAASGVAPLALAKDVKVMLTRGEGAKADCDPTMIERAMTALIENAIKFSPPGGSVSVAVRRADSQVEFTVSDEGIGIPADALPRVFERFFKVEGSRHTPGWGLGLSIVKHIIEAHGGKVLASSTEGKGSTFGFSLPARD